jgi:hypothetical protein
LSITINIKISKECPNYKIHLTMTTKKRINNNAILLGETRNNNCLLGSSRML